MIIQRKGAQRSNTGSLYAVGFVAAIPLMIAIGAFSVDTMHYNAVQAEVQRAADAGALAGAMELWQYGSHPQAPGDTAKLIAGMNDADGKPVSTVSGATVDGTVEVIPTPTVGGQVRCTVQRPYKNLFATIFGNGGATITCSALAGPLGSANVASYGGLFPLAIANNIRPDGPDSDKKAFNEKTKVGDSVYLEFHKNIAWTGFDVHNAKAVDDFIKGYMKPGASPKASPPVPLGGDINVTHGIQASNVKDIEGFTAKGTEPGDILWMPVVDESVDLKQGDYKVIGFVGLEITKLVNNGANSYLVGKITNSTFRGTFDPKIGLQQPGAGGILGNIQTQPAKLLI